MRSSGGEIVQVEGGHIVRSTGRKDRHSKVYTSKGPRDRRVRLSAHTAIEFYDVQDRLGYDRPSKAVDWLIKKAKPSIDKLAELPPWNPPIHPDQRLPQEDQEHNMANINEEQSESSAAGYNNLIHLQQRQLGGENNQGNHHSAFISPHVVVDTNPIPFFPTTSATCSSNINFQSYPPDIITRTNNPTQDLGLSLHSFQHHPGLIHPWQSQQAAGGEETEENHAPSNERQHQTLFAAGSTTTPVGFENQYQRIVTWDSEITADHVNKVGFMQVVNSQQFSASEYSQSGTLHSSFSPSARSNWNDIVMAASSEHHHRSQQQVHHQASIFGSRFVSDGLAGFCNIPDRIDQGGEEEEDNGVASNRPSSASTSSQH